MSKPPPWIMDSQGRMIYTIEGDDPWEPQLTPGADLAKRRGCTCSRLDNKWGVGTRIEEILPGDNSSDTNVISDYEFLVTPGCPLHDTSRMESAPDSQVQRPDSSDESSS